MKLNFDNALKANLGCNMRGGILRDANGYQIACCAQNIGISTNNKEEMLALHLGLNFEDHP
jgi:hypothetical protein